MSTLAWIMTGGLAMSAIALAAGVTLVLPEEAWTRLALPLVALAAGDSIHIAAPDMVPEVNQACRIARAVGHFGASREVRSCFDCCVTNSEGAPPAGGASGWFEP